MVAQYDTGRSLIERCSLQCWILISTTIWQNHKSLKNEHESGKISWSTVLLNEINNRKNKNNLLYHLDKKLKGIKYSTTSWPIDRIVSGVRCVFFFLGEWKNEIIYLWNDDVRKYLLFGGATLWWYYPPIIKSRIKQWNYRGNIQIYEALKLSRFVKLPKSAHSSKRSSCGNTQSASLKDNFVLIELATQVMKESLGRRWISFALPVTRFSSISWTLNRLQGLYSLRYNKTKFFFA